MLFCMRFWPDFAPFLQPKWVDFGPFSCFFRGLVPSSFLATFLVPFLSIPGRIFDPLTPIFAILYKGFEGFSKFREIASSSDLGTIFGLFLLDFWSKIFWKSIKKQTSKQHGFSIVYLPKKVPKRRPKMTLLPPRTARKFKKKQKLSKIHKKTSLKPSRDVLRPRVVTFFVNSPANPSKLSQIFVNFRRKTHISCKIRAEISRTYITTAKALQKPIRHTGQPKRM